MRITNKFWAAIAFLAIVVMVSQVALAQNEQGRRGRGNRGGGGGGMGMFGPPSMARLASIDKVAEELKLTSEQKDKIQKINDDSRAEMRKLFDGGGRPDPEKMRELRDDQANKVKEVLNEDQQKRLTGIFVQLMGNGAVMDPVVGKAIDLTDDQKSKLREAIGPPPEGGQRPGGGGGGESFQARREKMEKEVASVLTDEQKKKLESLKGEKFELDMSALRGGPGGGDGQRGNRPNRGRDRGNRGTDQPAEKKSAA
jgi:Spy/CpxP family protein refolding chaperone